MIGVYDRRIYSKQSHAPFSTLLFKKTILLFRKFLQRDHSVIFLIHAIKINEFFKLKVKNLGEKGAINVNYIAKFMSNTLQFSMTVVTVSYTHLTLPTILLV